MLRIRFVLNVILILILMLIVSGEHLVLAVDGGPAEPTTPERKTTIVVSYTKYNWWIMRWFDNSLLCSMATNHEGWPTGDEIYGQCGKTIYNLWASTPTCNSVTKDSSDTEDCAGLYLHLVSSQPSEREIEVDLPAATIWASLADCQKLTSERHCANLPSLLLSGDEPLPDQQITAIHALVNGKPYHCEGSTCKIPLPTTTMMGVAIEFWADSSFGDSSEHFTALVRVVDSGVSASPTGGGWYIDVLSSQWQGSLQSTCAQIWDVFPPVSDLPYWLTTPQYPALIASAEPYQYLAGRLIAQGLVNAKTCSTGGLLSNGYADACGLEQARPLVEQWQNQFDQQIIQTAKDTGIPGQLMKNLFAQESQFWPGAFKDPKENGLGQLTDNGAEAILLWNQTFFNQFCPLVLGEDYCNRGYVYLKPADQALVRGALAVKVNADCRTCPDGIDLENAQFSVNLFAQTLIANCAQVSRIVYNASARSPAAVTDYESLWRFTVANYHVGAGCLSFAIYTTWTNRETLNWENVSTNFTPACEGVLSYVDKVTR